MPPDKQILEVRMLDLLYMFLGIFIMLAVVGVIAAFLYVNVRLAVYLCRRLGGYETDKYFTFRNITLSVGCIYALAVISNHYHNKLSKSGAVEDMPDSLMMLIAMTVLIPLGGFFYGLAFKQGSGEKSIGYSKGLIMYAAQFALLAAVIIPVALITMQFVQS
jgi:hypothetical protein